MAQPRLKELARVREVRTPVVALQAKRLLLVNAVRGIVPLASLAGRAVRN